MCCKCASWCEIVIGALVVIFALWQTSFSKWVLIALGVILIAHSFVCKMCCKCCDMPEVKPVAKKKK